MRNKNWSMRNKDGSMRNKQDFGLSTRGWTLRTAAGAMALAVLLMAGCESKQSAAIDTAKKQAAATGQAQQVVSVDKDGNTTTTTIQPPTAGQTTQQVTTVTTPAQSGQATASNGQPPAPGQPAPGGAPIIRPADVNIPAGSELAIRIDQRISVKTTPAGATFDGEVVDAWTDGNGRVVLPKGTPVRGLWMASHRRGHFKGVVGAGAAADVADAEWAAVSGGYA